MTKTTETKHAFHAKVKKIDIQDGESLIAVLNEHDAWELGVNKFDKIEIKHNGEYIVADADLTQHLVARGEIGLFAETTEKLHVNNKDIVSIHHTQRENLTVNAIKKKMRGEDITEEEINSIIKDISENKLTDTLATYYVASSFFKETSDKEMYLTAKAMAENGVTFKYPKDEIIADKHCIGGVPGNETTMIMIPLLASLGITMPKNFSKAITSPAATGECVSVLMNTEFEQPEIEHIIKECNACLIWGGALDLAPADDKLIKIQYPLAMQNIAKVVSSIMAKKYAMGVSHSLIDIPMGPTAKVKNIQEAQEWKQKFETVGKGLGMKMTVQITEANEPIGAGIGAVLQVREVLRVLQQHPKRPTDLEEKAVFLASKIIEIVGLAQGEEAIKLAYGQLVSGKAWEKMQQIIKVQAYNKEYTAPFVNGKTYEVKSEELKLAEYSEDIVAESDGEIKNIDMKQLNMVTRSLGAPHDLQAGIYLHHKTGATVKKGEVLFTLYANSTERIDTAKTMLEEKAFIEMK